MNKEQEDATNKQRNLKRVDEFYLVADSKLAEVERSCPENIDADEVLRLSNIVRGLIKEIRQVVSESADLELPPPNIPNTPKNHP